MRVAIYNQMFGLDGRRFFSNLVGHWAIHFQGNENEIWKRVDLEITITIIKKSNADIIGICEVLEAQYEQFKKMLNEIGYKWVYFGKGHKLKNHNMHIIEVIASKFPCKHLDVGDWLVENRLGGGGGLVGVNIPKLNATVFSVHLALSSRKYFYQQIEFIAQKINAVKGKVILIGDFNLGFEGIKQYFPGLKLASGRIKSCSITRVMKWIYNEDVDHILFKGFEKEDFGEIAGYSDHKLIWANLK
jgi:endonuclease/exonuclease/phosphatase family metal-dependent hydrolase